jgi:hypothetical protein
MLFTEHKGSCTSYKKIVCLDEVKEGQQTRFCFGSVKMIYFINIIKVKKGIFIEKQ